MSRSGYSEDLDNWALIRWRGQLASAIRGARGQAFLCDLITALEAMPVKRLIRGELQQPDGEVCALGAVGVMRGIDMTDVDTEDAQSVALMFGIAQQLACEIEFQNDEAEWSAETPEERWTRLHEWARDQLRKDTGGKDA